MRRGGRGGVDDKNSLSLYEYQRESVLAKSWGTTFLIGVWVGIGVVVGGKGGLC